MFAGGASEDGPVWLLLDPVRCASSSLETELVLWSRQKDSYVCERP